MNWNFDDYKNTLEYPSFKQIQCQCGRFKINSKFSQSVKNNEWFCSKCGENLKEKFDKEKERYETQDKLYCDKQIELSNKFRDDFMKYFEIEDNPKKDRFFSICYEHGHSSGLSEIVNVAYGLIDLIK